ncbi:MAG: adenosylcobinamide amidohydrolase, partial [Candidatus Omnitrophica bacterium]|nr:adenosylcobinamide amidohydrolase [Candidatus Omnitrophota bacterium]
KVRAEAVAWYEVRPGDLHPEIDPAEFLEERLRTEGLAGAVGLMTSRRLDPYSYVEKKDGAVFVSATATVGLSNALRVGDPAGEGIACGTINVLCHVSRVLTEEAMMEALSIAVEARTAAVMEDLVASRVSSGVATGTGTDCVVLASPVPCSGSEKAERYAGKHTRVGSLIGGAVYEAMKRGVAGWKEERREKERIQP